MLWCYILFLYYLPFTLSHSAFDKRQAVASKACGDRDQTVGICSPSSTDTWYNNTYHELTWNYNNPVFNGFETLTFHLLQQNGSSDYQQIKSFDVVHAVGVQVVLVDDTWYPSPLPANSPNVTRTVFTYLIGSGVDLQQELDNTLSIYPRPSRFTMIQNAHNTTTVGISGSPSPTSSSSSTNQSQQNNQGSSSSLPAWAIAIITIAAVAVVIAAIAFAWLLRNMRRNRQRDHQLLNKSDMDHDEILDNINNDTNGMSQVGDSAAILGFSSTNNNNNNNSNNSNSNNTINPHQIDTHDHSSSIHSSTPMIHGSIKGSPTAASPSIERSPSITTNTTSATTAVANSPIMNPAALNLMQQQQSDGSSHQQASSILSSTDALMIADTFRHLLRKPNWSDTAGASGDNDDDDETEEQQRKRVGNELLQQQLAKEEGATVKDIERR